MLHRHSNRRGSNDSVNRPVTITTTQIFANTETPWPYVTTALYNHVCKHRHRPLLPPHLAKEPREHELSPSPDKHTTPSSSTQTTSQTDRNPPSQSTRESPRHASSLTTATTTTSFTPHNQEEEIPHGPENAFFASLQQRKRDLQKELLHTSELKIFGNSYCIVSVEVSRQHIRLAIQQERNSTDSTTSSPNS